MGNIPNPLYCNEAFRHAKQRVRGEIQSIKKKSPNGAAGAFAVALFPQTVLVGHLLTNKNAAFKLWNGEIPTEFILGTMSIGNKGKDGWKSPFDKIAYRVTSMVARVACSGMQLPERAFSRIKKDNTHFLQDGDSLLGSAVIVDGLIVGGAGETIYDMEDLLLQFTRRIINHCNNTVRLKNSGPVRNPAFFGLKRF